MRWFERAWQFFGGRRPVEPRLELAPVPVAAGETAAAGRHARGIIDHCRHVSSIGRR